MECYVHISPGGSFLEPVVARGMGNKICLPMILHKENIFYSLNTEMYQSFTGDYSSRNTHHVQELYNCCWIQAMPTLTFNQDQDFEGEREIPSLGD